MADHVMHQIGEVADAVGLSLRTIRHYDELRVVVPSGRSTGGFRLYTDDDVDRLRLVKRMKPLDFSLDEIREVLALLDAAEADDRADAHDVGDRLGMFAALAVERCERLREQLAAASELTGILTRTARRLGADEVRRG